MTNEETENYRTAISLLKCVLLESGIENEFDNDIKEFLEGIGELDTPTYLDEE